MTIWVGDQRHQLQPGGITFLPATSRTGRGAIAARSGDSRGLQALQRAGLSTSATFTFSPASGGYMISTWGHA